MSSSLRAPLTLEKSGTVSVIRSATTSSASRRIYPAADLREATEQNAQEKCDKDEAARLEKVEAETAAASAKRKLDEA